MFVDACSSEFYIFYVLFTRFDNGYLWYGMSGQIIDFSDGKRPFFF